MSIEINKDNDLLDAFASDAMATILNIALKNQRADESINADYIASEAYDMAAAMMAERDARIVMRGNKHKMDAAQVNIEG